MNEKEFSNQIGTRYEIDFRLVPKMFMKAPIASMHALLEDRMCDLLASIFNDAYNGERNFNTNEFKSTRYVDEDDFVYYIRLPEDHDGQVDHCEAYGFAFIRDEDDMAAQFFMVNNQNDGDRLLCCLDVNLERIEFKDALLTDHDNAIEMLKIAKSNYNGKNPVKVKF